MTPATSRSFLNDRILTGRFAMSPILKDLLLDTTELQNGPRSVDVQFIALTVRESKNWVTGGKPYL